MAKKSIEVLDYGRHLLPDEFLQNAALMEEWEAWIEERRLKGNPVTENAAKRAIKFLATQPNPIAVLSKAIMCGWTGLWPVRENGNLAKFVDGSSDRERF